jgi:Spy/CpxP family protein refolding chaperone
MFNPGPGSRPAAKGNVMKTWIKRTLIGLLGATVVLGGIAACSHHRHHGDGWRPMSEEDAAKFKAKLVDRAASRLDLDEAQKGKLAVLADKLREQRNALVAGTPDPRAELQSLVAGATFDRAKAQALVEGKTGAIAAKSPEVIAAAADFYDSLRPEQQAKVREMMSAHRGWWQRG